MQNFETGGLSLEEKDDAEKRVQQMNEGEQQFQPNTEEAAALAQEAEALAEEAEVQATADEQKAQEIVAQLTGEKQAAEADPATFENASALLMKLAAGVKTAEGQIDMGMGTVSPAARTSIQELKGLLPKVDQAKLAEQFHQAMDGRTEESYQVYMALKGTEFASKFNELEGNRLKEAGYGDFKI